MKILVNYNNDWNLEIWKKNHFFRKDGYIFKIVTPSATCQEYDRVI